MLKVYNAAGFVSKMCEYPSSNKGQPWLDSWLIAIHSFMKKKRCFVDSSLYMIKYIDQKLCSDIE